MLKQFEEKKREDDEYDVPVPDEVEHVCYGEWFRKMNIPQDCAKLRFLLISRAQLGSCVEGWYCECFVDVLCRCVLSLCFVVEIQPLTFLPSLSR